MLSNILLRDVAVADKRVSRRDWDHHLPIRAGSSNHFDTAKFFFVMHGLQTASAQGMGQRGQKYRRAFSPMVYISLFLHSLTLLPHSSQSTLANSSNTVENMSNEENPTEVATTVRNFPFKFS